MQYQQAVRAAALAEREAEQTREKAEARWRAAWWETTLALAAPTTRIEQTAAYDEAARVLGHSRAWLQDRARTGRAFRSLEATKTATLPPRLAVAWMRTHSGQQAGSDTAAELRQAEESGTSLRDYAARLGQAFETPAPEQVRRMPVEQRAEVVREALADPQVARRVAADPDTAERLAEPMVRDTAGAGAVARAQQRVAREREAAADEREATDRPNLRRAEHFLYALGQLDTARYALARGLDRLQEHTLTDAETEQAHESLGRVRDVADWWQSYLDHGAKATDDAIAAWLEGGSS